MTDDARIGLDRTAVPVELDRISSSLDDLLVALGPNGANKDGAFADVLDTGAKNLDGQGQKLHDTNRDLSQGARDPVGWPQRPVRHGQEPAGLHHDARHQRHPGAPPQQPTSPASPTSSTASATTSRRP